MVKSETKYTDFTKAFLTFKISYTYGTHVNEISLAPIRNVHTEIYYTPI